MPEEPNGKDPVNVRVIKRLHDGLRIQYESLGAGVQWEASAAIPPPVFRRYLDIHYASAETPHQRGAQPPGTGNTGPAGN